MASRGPRLKKKITPAKHPNSEAMDQMVGPNGWIRWYETDAWIRWHEPQDWVGWSGHMIWIRWHGSRGTGQMIGSKDLDQMIWISGRIRWLDQSIWFICCGSDDWIRVYLPDGDDLVMGPDDWIRWCGADAMDQTTRIRRVVQMIGQILWIWRMDPMLWTRCLNQIVRAGRMDRMIWTIWMDQTNWVRW